MGYAHMGRAVRLMRRDGMARVENESELLPDGEMERALRPAHPAIRRGTAYRGRGDFSSPPMRCPGLIPLSANQPRFISSAKRAGDLAQ